MPGRAGIGDLPLHAPAHRLSDALAARPSRLTGPGQRQRAWTDDGSRAAVVHAPTRPPPTPAEATDAGRALPPEQPAGGAPTVGGPPSAGRMRARLARIGTKGQPGNPVLEPLFRAVRANHPKADLALLERAYLTAERLHARPEAQERRPLHHPPARGDHDPRRLGMTEPTLVAALLHDTVEDTPYTLDERARATSATRSPSSSTASPSSTR